MNTALIFTRPELTRRPTDLSAISKPQRGPQLYNTYEEPNTCLSAEPHEQAVDDAVQHYFGCIEVCQRPNFFDPQTNHVWINEREVARKKLVLAMSGAQQDPSADDLETKLEMEMKERMVSVAIAIEGRYKRAEVLRRAIMKAQISSGQPALLSNVEQSRYKWLSSRTFKDGIQAVRVWRKSSQGGRKTTDPVPKGEYTVPNSSRTEIGRSEVQSFIKKHRTNVNSARGAGESEYSIEHDVHAYLMQFDVQEAKPTALPGSDQSTTAKHFLKPADDERTGIQVKGTFPDQRISMSRLLNDGKDLGTECDPMGHWNVLRRDINSDPPAPNRIRYLHIPSNNMAWVEKVIANYYAERKQNVRKKGQSTAIQTSTQLLLRPQYWDGQQQGTRSGIVHARHMRPVCEVVSSEAGQIEQSSKNIVLFMPYLHWETNRVRKTISRIIDGNSDRHRHNDRSKKEQQKARRVENRSELPRPGGNKSAEKPGRSNFLTRARRLTTVGTLTSTIERILLPREVNANVGIDATGRLQVRSELGQYLIDAARLYEAMLMFRDRKLVERYLFHDAPFHPRRTLRQCINRGFKSTVSRDKDQTVCQETSCDAGPFYKFVSLPTDFMGLGQRIITEMDKAKQLRLQHLSTARPMTEHYAYADPHGCEECRQNIMQVQRLIMVDQLWMWILDEQTIIKSFPQSWQKISKQTINGIHESVRARLRPLGTTQIDDQVQSIYEIGLIILTECCSVLLDRTNLNSQFQILDTFTEVIGRVRKQHTVMLSHLRHWLSRASLIYLPISFAIIISTIIIAFSKSLRGIVWSIYNYLSTAVVVHLGIYELWFAFRNQGRSPHEMFIRTMEMKVDQMKRDVERERRREERGKEFQRRTGKKLDEQPEKDDRQRSEGNSRIRHPSGPIDDDPLPNTSDQTPSPFALQVSSPGGTTERAFTPRHSNRFSIVRSRGVPVTLEEHELDSYPPDSFALDMTSDRMGSRIVDRRMNDREEHLPNGQDGRPEPS
ncbi:unnamed protein product [Sordaria macrospora k-hell]|uniref:WGS project CABT00000000 data, contig 2.91 n=1 Tax=Sordaria macrospora (strain ATCC MYA-333 / DSM 997 / K(L3346) / K-hell) TaxID=771870 RepID=F7WC05_SORMK|nr:uncharacterized protein SMAC_09429 [Sordaria macrospora k-hell]KAH7625149.1 hypothetical protein B0T09DRAFT_274540 [Sordaria sp. MPI-SDFR-AT-0083]CCC14530.1 unnamed protein product [Sordaria macrospora k-hell]